MNNVAHENQIKPNRLDRYHQSAVIVSLILLPLPGWPARIGLALLFVFLLRIPTTFNSIRSLLRMPIFLLFICWWLFAAISENWASVPTHSLLANPLLLFVIPSLYPALKRHRKFVLAIGIGAVIHTTIQAISWLGIVENIRYVPLTGRGGLHWYPPFTALWATCAFLLLLGLILNADNWKSRLAPLLIAIPLPLSLVLAGTRVLYIIIPFAIVILMIKLLCLLTNHIQRKTVIIVCIGINLTVVGSLVVPWASPNQNISRLVNEISTSAGNSDGEESDQFVNSVGLRYLWWKSGFKIWKKSAWVGHGNGTSKYQYAIQEAEMPTKYGADVAGFIIADPHSSVLATAMEQGLIGVLLLVSFILLTFSRTWKYAIANPSLVGLAACWLTIIGFSFVHTIQFSDYVSTLVVILFTFTLCMIKEVKSIL